MGTERNTKRYDVVAMQQLYTNRRLLSDVEFRKLFEDTMRVREANIVGLDWEMMDHVLSVYRHIPLEAHFEALCAGIDIPFNGIEDFLLQAIERGLVPNTVLNRTVFHQPPPGGLPLGAMMVATGLIDEISLQRCLGIQVMIRGAVGVRAAIGQILRSTSGVSIVDLFQILSFQVGIPYVGLDASAPAVFAAAMARTATPRP